MYVNKTLKLILTTALISTSATLSYASENSGSLIRVSNQDRYIEEFLSYRGRVTAHKAWSYDSTAIPHVLTTKSITEDAHLILRTDGGAAIISKAKFVCAPRTIDFIFSANKIEVESNCRALKNNAGLLYTMNFSSSQKKSISKEFRKGRSVKVAFGSAKNTGRAEGVSYLFSLMGYSAAGENFTGMVYDITDINSLFEITRAKSLSDALLVRLSNTISRKTSQEKRQLLAKSNVKSPVQVRKPPAVADAHQPDMAQRYAKNIARQVAQGYHPACSIIADNIRRIGNSSAPAYVRTMQVDRMLDKTPDSCLY